MTIEKDILDQLLAGRDPQEVFSRDGLVDELKKALSERILNAELDEHLGGERQEGLSNRRNGSSQETVLTGASKVTLDIPRDRSGTFDPKLIARYQRRFPDFDEKIISMYACGMTVREIRGHLARAAQPGESQRRPPTNASSKLILYIGLPAPSCSRSLCPGCSQHTPTARSTNGRNMGPAHLIPVTKAIEALNSKLRRAVRMRGHFPNDGAATKLLYLVLNRASDDWKRPPREWFEAKAQFAIMFGERFAVV